MGNKDKKLESIQRGTSKAESKNKQFINIVFYDIDPKIVIDRDSNNNKHMNVSGTGVLEKDSCQV